MLTYDLFPCEDIIQYGGCLLYFVGEIKAWLKSLLIEEEGLISGIMYRIIDISEWWYVMSVTITFNCFVGISISIILTYYNA